MSDTQSPENNPRPLDEGLQRIMARIDQQRFASRAAPEAAAKQEPPVKSAMTRPLIEQAQEQATQPPARIHPDKRGPLVLANAIAEARGEGKTISDALSYYSPELIQATLPHSDPNTRDWIRKSGNFSLIISSGIDSDAQPYGIPYGAFPRLVLAHIITRVIATHERRIELASHFGTFLREVGYTGNFRGNIPSARRIKAQLDRLLNARITFEYKEGDEDKGRRAVKNVDIAPQFDLWWDFKEPEQGSFFGSWIELSEGFYNAILANPVPLRTDVLKALHKDVLALDVYMWVSYRLFRMRANHQEVLELSYSALQTQFGTGIAEENYRKFRQQLKKAFTKVGQFWTTPSSEQSLLRYEFTETGVILYTSPLLVGRGNRATHQEDAAAILTSRRFDDETRRLARMQAKALYSVDHLEKQYFQWLDDKGYNPDKPPAHPRAHFIAFVKRHVARNK